MSKRSNFRFSAAKKLGSSKIYVLFKKKNSKDSIIAVECDWISKNWQNVQNLVIINKIYGFFRKKIDFVENAKCSKFTVECNWISKISQNFRNLVSSWKKKLVFQKNSWFFLKSLKGANLHYRATENVRILKLFGNLVFFFKKMDGSFRQKKILFPKKMIKAANLL